MSEQSFQQRVQPWLMACFGPMIAGDREERNHRFIEEALELIQACGATASEAHQLVDYVYGRPVGEKRQEVGGVMVTLAALCLANQMDMHEAGEVELSRIWTKVEQIRAKQAAKPKHSPLPVTPVAQQDVASMPIEALAAYLPDEVSWGEPLTPEIIRHVLNGAEWDAFATAPVAQQEPVPYLNELLRLVLANGEWSPQTATRLRDAIKATNGNPLYAAPVAAPAEQGERKPDDAARLDWLEQSAQSFCGNYSGSGFRMIGSSIWHGTLREAIDGAMLQGK